MVLHVKGYLGNSGFSSETDYNSKYMDEYLSNSSSSTYNNRILGDATGEMGPFSNDKYSGLNSWYSDFSVFTNANRWTDRGGPYEYGLFDSQFYFGHGAGSADSIYSFRIVLAPQ